MDDNKINSTPFLYELKDTLVTNKEMAYYNCIKSVVPEGYNIIPQANLASFVAKTDGSRYHNELFRNVDFLITDSDFKPYIVIEINDNSHNDYNRKKRDEKVSMICREAGIDIITLWTTYGVNREYITKRINTALEQYPPAREHCFSENTAEIENDYQYQKESQQTQNKNSKKIVSLIGIVALVFSLIGCFLVAATAISRNLPQQIITPTSKSTIFVPLVLGVVLGICDIINSKKSVKGLAAVILGAIGICLTFII